MKKIKHLLIGLSIGLIFPLASCSSDKNFDSDINGDESGETSTLPGEDDKESPINPNDDPTDDTKPSEEDKPSEDDKPSQEDKPSEDDKPSDDDKKDFQVTFSITKDAGFEKSLAIVGDFCDWAINDKAIKLTWTDGNVWTNTVTYSSSTTIKFKFVIYSIDNPSQMTFESGNDRTVTLSNTQSLNFTWQDESQHEDNPPVINDYVLYGCFDGSSTWTEKTITQKQGPNSEWCIISVSLKANDVFKVHMYGDTWYGFSDVKSSVASGIVKAGESDNNILVINDGIYDIYSDYNVSDNGHIYISKQGQSGEDDKIPNYCLHGQFNGSSEWTNISLEKSTIYSDTYTKTLTFHEGDRFIIHAYLDKWYGYPSLNSQVDRSLVSKASSDSNDIINKTGEYEISINLGHIEEYERIALFNLDDEKETPSIPNFAIYGKFGSSDKWSYVKLNANPAKQNEFVCYGLLLKKDDVFKIYMYDNIWRGFSDLKSSTSRENFASDGTSDDNILVLKEDHYNIYVVCEYEDGGYIHINPQPKE